VDEEQGITALGPEDLGTVEVTPNVEETEQKESAFPQFTDKAKATRGIEEFKSFKKGFKKALPYLGQLGADLVAGSGITEIFGMQPDIVEGGQRPSFAGQVERTTELAKEGKTTEAIVSGVDTLLTGAAGVGEGMMVAGAIAPSIYGKALAIAGWGLYGFSKGGRAILRNTKTGKKILADFEGDAQTGYDIKSIKIPENVESDDTIKTLEDTIDIETVRTDDTDTEVAIPELAQDLDTTEAITGYVVAPNKLDRDQLIAKVENDPEVKIKTDKYLEEQGVSGDTVPLYRLINVEDKVKRRLGDPFPEVLKKAEIGNESIISGSLTPKANIKTYDYFEPKVGVNTTTELVRYDVPRDRIKIAMGGFKNDIKQNVNKKLKEKGFGQEKISGLKTVTNPSKTAKELIDMQDEIIADVTGLEKTVLNKGPSFGLSDDVNAARNIINDKIKTVEDYKNFKGQSYFALDRDEARGLSNQEFNKANNIALEKEANKITDFYGLPRLGAPKQDEGIKALEPRDIETDNVVDKFYPNLKNKEIKKEGGFDWKTIDDPIKQSDVRLNRHIKRLEGVNKGEDYVGGPVNKRTVLKSDNPDNPDVVIGKQTFDDWKNTKIKQFKDNKEEIFEASKWYDNYVKEVKSIPNITKEEADTLIEASFAANINQSPEMALQTVLDVKEQLQKGISLNDVKIKGVPIIRESLRTVVGKQKGGRGSGIGSKISAFVDNAKDKNVRSDMGNDPRGGEPVTIDLQTLRSKGAVDNIYKNKLKDLGYKKEDGSDIDDIKIDFEKSGTQESKYDYFSFEMNQLTNHLNEINWLGKNNWKAKEVQAIDWLGQQKIFGKALPVEDIFNVNVQNITMEAAPSPSSPLGKRMLGRYKKLPNADQQSINDDITKKAVDIVAEREGEDLGNVIFGTGGWMRDVNPTTVKQSIMTHDKAKKVAAKLGELLQQDQVWVNTTKGGYTKNPNNHEIVIIEESTNNLQNNEKIFELFDKIIKKEGGDMIQGFHPITTRDGKSGLKILVDKEAVKDYATANKLKMADVHKKIQEFKFDDIIEELDYDVRVVRNEATLSKINTTFNKGDKDGQSVKRYTGDGGTRESDTEIQSRAYYNRNREQLEKDFENQITEAERRTRDIDRTGEASGVQEPLLKKDYSDGVAFFDDVIEGDPKYQPLKSYENIVDTNNIKNVEDIYEQKTKNFSNHINTSIPTFKETQIATADAVSKTLPPNAKVIDIGSTEGGFINTIGVLRKDVNALGIDPNKKATEVFNTFKEDNTEVIHRAFTDNKNEYNKKAFPDENTGEDVLYFNNDSIPNKSIDMISEKMTFQFIDKGREDKVKIIKSKLKPNGFALFEEKFFTGENDIKWISNENKKDKFKEQYYSKEEISDKAKKVLRKMNKRQVTPNEFEKVLKNNFKNVVQYWDAGNFKGYIASDSEATISKFTDNLINLDNDFSTVDPKRIVQGMKETTSIEVEIPSIKPKVVKKKKIAPPIKKSFGGFIERNTYDWVYRDG